MRKLSVTLCLTLAVLLGSTGMSFSVDNQRTLTFVQSANFEQEPNIRDRFKSSICNFKKVKNFQPKHIVLEVTPISITNVDEEKSSFLMNFYFGFEYEVPFFSENCEITRNNLKDVFNPRFEFMNQNEINRLKPYNIFFNKNKIRVGTKYSAHLQSDFDWTMFPFDTQTFSLDIMHYYTRNKLKMNYTTEVYDADTYKINTINWNLLNYEVEQSNEVWGGEEYEKIKLNIKMERSSISLLTRIFLPSFFITMLSVSAFLLPLKELESRITLQIASVISLSAFYVVVDQKLPDLPYLTLAGYFILFCFSISICSIFYTLFKYVARSRGF